MTKTCVLDGVQKVRQSGVKIHEVYSPFPVHGLDEVLGYKRTRLPIAAFLFGMTGTALALIMQIWMLGYDWPMIIGGKELRIPCLPLFLLLLNLRFFCLLWVWLPHL